MFIVVCIELFVADGYIIQRVELETKRALRWFGSDSKKQYIWDSLYFIFTAAESITYCFGGRSKASSRKR